MPGRATVSLANSGTGSTASVINRVRLSKSRNIPVTATQRPLSLGIQCYKGDTKHRKGKTKLRKDDTTGEDHSIAPTLQTASTPASNNAVAFKKMIAAPTIEELAQSFAEEPWHAELHAAWERISKRNPHEPEFLQAVKEVMDTMKPVFAKRPEFIAVFERMAEPERMILFRVPWVDDEGVTQVNRGYRVQFSSTLGPYKGGLRFHPSVNLSVIKFLGFEQILKNSLTTLPLGGGKGGSDFDPKGRSDGEVMRFCQSFMTELSKHIGADTDVPAGDIGVGGREVGYLFGQYKRLCNEFTGTLTGKGMAWGGSNIRPEATGYGAVYFTQEMLQDAGMDIAGKTVAISGSGNVALYAAEKLLDLGAKPVTVSDSAGTLYAPQGITSEMLAELMQLKNVKRGRLSEYTAPSDASVVYYEGRRPWQLPEATFDIAMPCATQNEVDEDDAKALVTKGCLLVTEGANMPCTPEAIDTFHLCGVLFAPAKAANAGGVAVSGLEMSQNSQRLRWTREEVDDKLKAIMHDIHESCRHSSAEYSVTLQAGANISGFVKVAESMLAQGVV